MKQALSYLFAAMVVTARALAQQPDFVPQPGAFAPLEKGNYIAGELVYIDPVNRRLIGNPAHGGQQMLELFTFLPPISPAS